MGLTTSNSVYSHCNPSATTCVRKKKYQYILLRFLYRYIGYIMPLYSQDEIQKQDTGNI